MTNEPVTQKPAARKPRAVERDPIAPGAAPAVPKLEVGSGATQGEEREDVIRRMAYSLYEARGYIGGRDIEDWLRAEALVALASVDSPVPQQPGAADRRAPSRSAASKKAASGSGAEKPAAAKPAAAGAKKVATKSTATKKAPAKRAKPKPAT